MLSELSKRSLLVSLLMAIGLILVVVTTLGSLVGRRAEDPIVTESTTPEPAAADSGFSAEMMPFPTCGPGCTHGAR